MSITGRIKDDIVADIFGRQVGDVLRLGLSDAESGRKNGANAM
jgi:hypothetical protein